MLNEELRGHIAYALDRDGLSSNHTIGLIKHRINGVTSEQLIAAALTLLRDERNELNELEREFDDLLDQNDSLLEEVSSLEAELEALRTALNKIKSLTS